MYVYIYKLPLEILLSRGEGWNPSNQLSPPSPSPTFLCLSQSQEVAFNTINQTTFPLISQKDIVSFNRLTLDTENNGSVRHIMEEFIYIITTVNSKKIFVSHCRPKLLTGWSIDRDFFLLTKYYETDILIIIINSLLHICRSIQGLITAVKHDNH